MGRIVAARKKRILVADDDKTVRESFKQILEKQGYIVDLAETGIEALEKMWVRYCDLVIINMKLPDMTGEELQAKINSVMPHIKTTILGMIPVSPERLLTVVDDSLKRTSQ